MLLRVIAEDEGEFNKWAAEQQQPAQSNAQLGRGRATFESLSCVNCHTVKGTPAVGEFGPDLTHLMSRQTIGAGVLPNTEAHLRAWVNDPQQAKPGCFLPSMKLTHGELDEVVAYLQDLD
jgi:cytochrome c oxidase subunit 2